MKRLPCIVFLLPVLVLVSCNRADDADYESMATDICDCVNKNSETISAGMKQAFIDAATNGKDSQAAVVEYALKNPETGAKDAEAMPQVQSGVESCLNDLRKKYDGVYANESEDEAQRKLLEKLDAKNCDFAYAMARIGMEK